ncbi:MAG: hypothetical protein LBR50_05135 [Tannerella sp.]|jgi:hypothetical protein|nr:hypothetical protein [Tannerella sp.]
MQYIVSVLILFILIGNVLKLSFWRLWQATVFSCLCGLSVVVAQRWAVTRSKTQLDAFLADSAVMQNFAVLLTVEAIIAFSFCFTGVFTEGKKSSPLQTAFHWYPGLLVFPALFYLQTQLIFSTPGVNFSLLSYSLATAVAIALPLLSRLIKNLCPEKELRLEVYFLVSLFVCILGLITSANKNIVYM